MAGCLASNGDEGHDDGDAPVEEGATGDTLESRTTQSTTGRHYNWLSAGHDIHNTRNAPLEYRLNASNASKLGYSWVFQTEGDVWATPSVDDNAIYFPDAKGNLFAVSRRTGKKIWGRKVAEYTGVEGTLSRNTPAIYNNMLFSGDQGGRTQKGATVYAVDKRTGNKLWATKVEESPAAVITASPIVYGNTVYVGVSSYEEVYAAKAPGYKCCSFRGSFLALDRDTGKLLWKTYLTPDLPGYSGVALWSSTPVIDIQRGSVYITTGNNYTVPQQALDCQGLPTPDEVRTCVSEVPGWEDNHFDSLVSLDMKTGKIKWARSMVPFDSWNIACIAPIEGNESNCTSPHGEDYDFGNGAILYTATISGRQRQLLGAGQKSGMYWAVDPSNGEVVWNTQVGPGGSLGGLEWGSAYDGTRIYTAVANSGAKPYKMAGSDEEITSGSWAALDPATGKILWQTRGTPAVQGSNQGPVTVANGVVYGGTIDAAGTMYAFDARTGKTLWTFVSGGSVNTSPAVVDGTLYWGSGYGVPGFGITPNNRMFAFQVGGTKTLPVSDAGVTDGGVTDGGKPDANVNDGGIDAATDAAADAKVDATVDATVDAEVDAEVDTGVPPTGPTWTKLWDTYLGPGTVGACNRCHGEAQASGTTYDWLAGLGQIGGTGSKLAIDGQSRLTWFGGGMPLGGPKDLPQAEADFKAWAAAGALKN